MARLIQYFGYFGSPTAVFYNGVGKRLRRGSPGCTTQRMTGNYDEVDSFPTYWNGLEISCPMADTL